MPTSCYQFWGTFIRGGGASIAGIFCLKIVAGIGWYGSRTLKVQGRCELVRGHQVRAELGSANLAPTNLKANIIITLGSIFDHFPKMSKRAPEYAAYVRTRLAGLVDSFSPASRSITACFRFWAIRLAGERRIRMQQKNLWVGGGGGKPIEKVRQKAPCLV